MRIGLIGCTGHWRYYAAALQALPDLEVGAVAVAAPEERIEQFQGAPGVTPATKTFASAGALLDAAAVDVVQVCTRPDLIGRWVLAAVERGLAVMGEKPIASCLEELRGIYDLARSGGVPVSALHTQRAAPALAAARAAVQDGAIGTPLLAHSQKSYRWGAARPDFLRSRDTFPGVAPFIGIHVFDWLLWLLGDRFAEVSGAESAAARPDYAACASHAAYLLQLSGGGVATVTLDYLRPEAAPTHGEARVRIVGTGGVIEVGLEAGEATLLDARRSRPLPLPSAEEGGGWYARFCRAARGEGQPLVQLWEACRTTEVALKAQQAVDTGRPVDLRQSPYQPEPKGDAGRTGGP